MNLSHSLHGQRTRWFSSEMRKHLPAYTNDKNLLLFTGTWNVNGRPPDPTIDLSQWLFPASTDTNPYDVYMLALQEVQSLSGVDSIRTDTLRGDLWSKRLSDILTSDYELIADRQMVGIIVMVFLRKNHVPYLSNVQLSYAATGFLNAVGNKGGVAASFQLYDHTIACVACHLAAHTQNVERRNQDFRDVVRKAVFLPEQPPDITYTNSDLSSNFTQPHSASALTRATTSIGEKHTVENNASALPAAALGTGSWFGTVASQAAAVFSDMSAGANAAMLNDPNAIQILHHDAVFWLGDLNYRIDAPISDVMKWIKESNWEQLFRADQLQYQMKTCDIFTGFKEGKVHFAPTYKLNLFDNEYALDETGELKRIPAYTDRILWRIGGGPDSRPVRAKQQLYNCARDIMTSDHRPVHAVFRMTFAVEDAQRRKTVEKRVNKELEARQAMFRPSLHFSAPCMDFGDVFFNQTCQRRIKVVNRGESLCVISVLQPKERPKWLLFDDKKYKDVQMAPGQSLAIEAGVKIMASNGTANEISNQGCSMDIVLNVVGEPGGLKEQIQLRAQYVATCLGVSLETLSMVAEPVLTLRSSKYKTREEQYNQHPREADSEHRRGPNQVPLPMPKELWLLIEALIRVHENAQDIYVNRWPNIFVRHAEERETQRVLAFIDRGDRIPNDLSGYAIADCMLNVLRNLHDPVIPRYAYQRAIEAAYMEDPARIPSVINLLPPLNSNVFWYIIGFLCRMTVVKSRGDPQEEVAEAFAEVLLTPEKHSHPRDARLRTAFILGAIRYQQRKRTPAYHATIDLSDPAKHPRKMQDEVLR